MTVHRSDVDSIRTIVLEPAVCRAFWSRPRAWKGDLVRMHVETRWVPDGTPVAFEIWEDDSGEGSPDDFVARREGLTIENNRCIVEHELVWDDETLGDPGENEGAAYEFYFKALVGEPALEGRSNLLYVALEDFKPSG
jgi:hypothetical protein